MEKQLESNVMPPQYSRERFLEDLNRDVWCLFGLPVDNLTMESAKQLIREKVNRQGPYVLSTINVNWVAQSLKDSDFRAAIINSDIVTIDGRPLLWLSKMLGYPMREVVAGSSLIEELLSDTISGEPLTLYLFGGEEGIAERAMERVNCKQGGLRVVGYCSPGFGSVEEMSSEKIIAGINAVKPDILLVALGAKKGSKWIELNRNLLDAKIISHLGATINFLAGTVSRAPRFIQNIGMEWIWRIVQEPKLFSRYAKDGVLILSCLTKGSRFWPRYFSSKRKTFNKSQLSCCNYTLNEQSVDILVGKVANRYLAEQIQVVLKSSSEIPCNINLDFQDTTTMDGAFVGFLIALQKYQSLRATVLHFKNINKKAKEWLNFYYFDKPLDKHDQCRYPGI